MNSRPDLEIKISERLKTLSAEHMQRLAEEYVRIRYPERFSHFDFRAFSEEGKSRAGWPDAFVVHDGRIDGVEATIAKDKGKVKEHILQDIEKASQQRPAMSGFVFISGHPGVQFEAKELTAFKQGFAQAGVPSDRCELIFGMLLVGELAKPLFALLRHGILNLPISPKKFSLVVPNLAWESQQLLFIPSVEDYRHGRVYRPQAADEVRAILDKTGRVLVKGIGASGKTVLARLLSLDSANQGLPSYYLDLARFDERLMSGGELTRDMDDFGGQGVLFILDNVHLNELIASELASHWECLASGYRPNLLLLGRELHSERGSSISGLEIQVIPLKARQPEVLGVYRRLAGRDNAPGFVLPQPPPEVLDQWVATFGGDPYALDMTTDLIAFSAAVLDQLTALMNGHWTLTEQHAVDAIRVHYLDKLGPEETDNLMRLAVLAELEISLLYEALVDHCAAFKTASRRLGLVFQYKARGHTSYRLAHAALGRLLLKASYKTVDVAKEQCAAALAHPLTGFAMGRRMYTLGQTEQEKEVVVRLMSRSECLLELGHFMNLYLAIQQTQRSEAAALADIAKVLCHADNHGRLLQMALDSPLDALKIFMEYVGRTKVLEPVFTFLVDTLVEPDNREALIRNALATPFHYLRSFMAFSKRTKGLQTVFTGIAGALAEPHNRESLIQNVLASPLDFLKDFMVFAERTKVLKSVFDVLVCELEKPENSKLLAKSFVAAPLDKLVAILKGETAAELWQSVLVSVDAEVWQLGRLQEDAPKVDAFISFQKYVVACGKPEFVAAPALNMVRRPSRQNWHTQGVGLQHLSHVLRCADKASPDETVRFLDSIATTDWVDEQIGYGAKSGVLAGALLSLATVLPEQQRRHFLRPSLEQRVRDELAACRPDDYSAWACGISLLGAAALLGLRIETIQLPCPRAMDLSAIVELRKSQTGRPGIGPLQVQLWMGLRELARLCGGLSAVPAAEAETILKCWRDLDTGETGQSLPPSIRQNNAMMIAWMERCQAEEWRLLP